MFPSNEGKRGAPWQDHRQMVNGMFRILCSGAPLRNLPERYGKWKTVYDRFRRYQIEGMFDELLSRLQLQLNEEVLIDYALWEAVRLAVDSTTIRAHKSAAGAGEKGGTNQRRKTYRSYARWTPRGRSRGGFRTKIHWLSDSKGLPLAASLSSGPVKVKASIENINKNLQKEKKVFTAQDNATDEEEVNINFENKINVKLTVEDL